MKCVILVAGEGKRMHPITYTRPKVMIPVAFHPILEWNLVNSIKAGIKDFLFVVGYKSEMIREYFKNGDKWNINIEYVNQGKALGTAHAINMVENFVDDFIVLCGDTIFNASDIKKISNGKNCIGLFKSENPKDYGIVEIRDNKIKKIHEKPQEPFTDIINAGIYRFDKRIFDYINRTIKSIRGEYEITDSINLMSNEIDIHGIKLEEWIDIVYPWDLININKKFLRKISTKIHGELEENTKFKDRVIIKKDTIIKSGSYIEGPVIIGNNCKIGPNCYIRPYTSIGDNCHVGNACEIKNSIIMSNSSIPHHNYVGDSIIGESCNLGAGSKIANLRFDKKDILVNLNGKEINTNRKKLGVIMGDNVQIGVNSVINTGTLIGNNCFIGPGSITQGEVKPNTRIY
jgi:bifunctional UDP-N-acetylglucosamine pyrophosphorylase/glucosamine-1-phosphate N-acetyltransferase